jgi:uncharacterized protein DUF6362
MTEIYWTPRLVEACLVEAADTLRRLPEPRVPGYVNSWPEVVEKAQVARGPAEGPTRLGPPSPAAIDQMDAVLRWLRWLEPDEQKIVWDRANRRPWKAIACAHDIERTTAWRRWTYALVTIAARLNAASRATVLQHHELQQFARYRVD